MMMDLDRRPEEPGTQINTDSWAGYRVPRRALLDRIDRAGLDSTIVLTGDEHQHFAGELHLDGQAIDGPPVATEFVATSISSGGRYLSRILAWRISSDAFFASSNEFRSMRAAVEGQKYSILA